MNEAAIEVIFQRLIDETNIVRHAKRRRRIQIAHADVFEVAAARTLCHGAAHFGCKRAGLADRMHRGMAGDDPFHQRGARARQAGDEDGRGLSAATRRGFDPPSRVCVDDRIDLSNLGGGIAGKRSVLQVTASLDVIKSGAPELEILAFLAERKAQHDFARRR